MSTEFTPLDAAVTVMLEQKARAERYEQAIRSALAMLEAGERPYRDDLAPELQSLWLNGGLVSAAVACLERALEGS